MTFWISTVLVVLLVPAAAVYATARIWKPRPERPTTPWERFVLVLGLPLSMALGGGSILLFVYQEPYTEENTVSVEVRITDVERDEDRINFWARASPVAYQVGTSHFPVFAYDAFLRDQDPDRIFTLRVDRVMYRIAMGQMSRGDIEYPERIDLLVFDLRRDDGLVWVYEIRSGEETYLSLDEANQMSERAGRVLLFFVVPVALVGFVLLVHLVAGLLKSWMERQFPR